MQYTSKISQNNEFEGTERCRCYGINLYLETMHYYMVRYFEIPILKQKALIDKDDGATRRLGLDSVHCRQSWVDRMDERKICNYIKEDGLCLLKKQRFWKGRGGEVEETDAYKEVTR